VPLDQPYTVTDAVTDYLAGYKRRSGKAIDRVEAVVRAWIEPELGGLPLAEAIQAWHQIADTPPRLRTKIGEAQKHREADASPEGVRRRRSAAIRVPTVLKAELIGPPMAPIVHDHPGSYPGYNRDTRCEILK
jgi:hypothetical protein